MPPLPPANGIDLRLRLPSSDEAKIDIRPTQSSRIWIVDVQVPTQIGRFELSWNSNEMQGYQLSFVSSTGERTVEMGSQANIEISSHVEQLTISSQDPSGVMLSENATQNNHSYFWLLSIILIVVSVSSLRLMSQHRSRI